MRNRDGFALEATILVMVLMSVLMLSAYTGAATVTRSAHLDYRASRVSYAAEAGADAIMAQLADALEDGYLDDYEMYAITAPEVEGFTFSSILAEKIGDMEVETVTDGAFAGLYSLTQKLEITSQAVDPLGNTSAVIVAAKAQALPIFQFGTFYEKDLEVTPGPQMDMRGWIHSNGNIYASSNNLNFWNSVTTPNKFFHQKKSANDFRNGVWIANASAAAVRVDFDSRSHPNPADFRARSDLRFNNRLRTDAYGVDSLSLPLPPGVDGYELIRRKETSDGDLERAAKYAWRADLTVHVDLTDIRTEGEFCGSEEASKLPDNTEANPGVSGQQPVLPGQKIKFKVGPNCGDVESYEIEAKGFNAADDEVYYQVLYQGSSCTFSLTIPADVDRLEVYVKNWQNKNDGGTEYQGAAFWEDLQSKLVGGTLSADPYPSITVTRTGGFAVPLQAEICAIFNWKWAAFYDGREQEYTDMLDIDLGLFTTWADGAADRNTNLMYIEFTVPDAALGSWTAAQRAMLGEATLDPAVRLKNGVELATPLSVATDHPMYIQGDFNKQNWKPASFVGDAVIILSNAWSDAEHQDAVVMKTNAQSTEVYGGMLAGHSETRCDWFEPGCNVVWDERGGSLENFPRFLEHWSGRTLTFKGSFVSLNVSRHATGQFICCSAYYYPPIRDWSFDERFQLAENLPPGTPVVGSVIHTAFRPVY